MKNAKKNWTITLFELAVLKLVYGDLLHISLLNTFWEIKENFATDITNIKFNSCEHTI